MFPVSRSRFLDLMVLIMSFFLIPSLWAGSENEISHRDLLPESVTLQPVQKIDPPAPWASASASVHLETDSIHFPVPSLATQDQIGCFALTTVFDDLGDGGPVLEWISGEGGLTLLSAGLGEQGLALGLNARTIVLPQSLTLDGGVLKVSYPGRFPRLISTTLRPAKELGVAVLDADSKPALIEANQHVLSEGEVSGVDENFIPGDRTDGRVIHADLATAPLRIDLPESGGVTEFLVPLATIPRGSMLHAEVGGLDPESWIEVTINGESRGVLSLAPFELNDPGTLVSQGGHLLVAGWRNASLFVPARLWHEGENSLVMTLHRSVGDAGKAVHLRRVRCDYLFEPTQEVVESSKLPPAKQTVTMPVSPVVVPTSTISEELLSTGSQYGNPSPAQFHISKPATLVPVGEVTPSSN